MTRPSASEDSGCPANEEGDQGSLLLLHNEQLLPNNDSFLSVTSKKHTAGTTTGLMNVHDAGLLYINGSALAFAAWVSLLLAVYAVTPTESLEVLQDEEKNAAATAFYLLLGSFSLATVNPVMSMMCREKRLNGIILAALTVQFISLSTNALLAWAPTPVMVDPVTHARVFLVRWCEWTPLAGLMTFLSEGMDIPKDNKKQLRIRIAASLMQSLSCFCGIVFPYCPNLVTWVLTMIVSCATYLVIFLRVYIKRTAFLAFSRGATLTQMEELERVSFAYYLLLVCSFVWSTLVVSYFANGIFIRVLPENHFLGRGSLAMVLDTFFDVFAKAVYMKLIVLVHLSVFDSKGRAQRQLGELRRLMSVLWYSSSDVIVISVRDANKTTTMFSPSFSQLLGAEMPPEVAQLTSAALLLEAKTRDLNSNPQECTNVSAAFFDETQLVSVDSEDVLVEEAHRLLCGAWDATKESASSLMVHMVKRVNGEELNCEVKVSEHSDSCIIAVIHDVTERYRRFEAERRARTETLVRQRDAQAINHFTRHEVKNGLLAGIELCDNLKSSFADLQKCVVKGDVTMQKLVQRRHIDPTASGGPDDVEGSLHRFIKELDTQLHETLGTVLTEAMARDVIHEVYVPRFERVDVKELLTSSNFGAGTSDRFPLELSPLDIPGLSLDPQLVRYIHRNAMSNACKYGKQGGIVKTSITYSKKSKELVMRVTNEPGIGHEKLMAMAEDAGKAVFAQGKSLHAHLKEESKSTSSPYITSGDGAWIMQKCATTMNGECKIRFMDNETDFAFRCSAEPEAAKECSAVQDFNLPQGTWGIAVDDSGIQRKLMARILSHVGVEQSKLIVLGKNTQEVSGLEDMIVKVIQENPKNKILLLVDENLDYRRELDQQILLSGSLVMQEVLAKMTPDQASRLCVLVRSANDSADEIALYTQRTHGFFPKVPMQQERVREMLAPLWTARFVSSEESTTSNGGNPAGGSMIWNKHC
jgi:hypothetical protein